VLVGRAQVVTLPSVTIPLPCKCWTTLVRVVIEKSSMRKALTHMHAVLPLQCDEVLPSGMWYPLGTKRLIAEVVDA